MRVSLHLVAAAILIWCTSAAAITLFPASPMRLPLLGGCALGVLAGLVLRRMPVWLSTHAHELSHAIAALATRGRVHQLHVSGRGNGHVVHDSRMVRLVSMAPYTLPLATVIGVAAVAAGMPMDRATRCVVLTALFGLHVMMVSRDIRACRRHGWHGTDFGADHPVLLLGWVVAINMMTFLAVTSYAAGGGRGILDASGAVVARLGQIPRLLAGVL